MVQPRTMHDIRTLRSVPSRAAPSNEGAMFLQLHRLASEKLRLEREVELWLRKKERIEKRLSEIEHQMESMRRASHTYVESRVSQPKRGWREVTLEY